MWLLAGGYAVSEVITCVSKDDLFCCCSFNAPVPWALRLTATALPPRPIGHTLLHAFLWELTMTPYDLSTSSFHGFAWLCIAFTMPFQCFSMLLRCFSMLFHCFSMLLQCFFNVLFKMLFAMLFLRAFHCFYNAFVMLFNAFTMLFNAFT